MCGTYVQGEVVHGTLVAVVLKGQRVFWTRLARWARSGGNLPVGLIHSARLDFQVAASVTSSLARRRENRDSMLALLMWLTIGG